MKTIICNLVLLTGILICSCGGITAQANKPNVLIIQPDQHRADVMGCAGNSMAITPNLDQMASEGIHFTHAASASPVCSPFRASMQTGLYIHEHGVVHNGIQLDHDIMGIAEILSDKGYATGYIGKWHLEGFIPEDRVGGWVPEGPARQGWQEWYGYEKSHEFLNVWQFNENRDRVPVEGYDWEPTWHTDMALDFIERKTEEGKPWCYYLAYGPPHKPEQCLPEFLEKYEPAAFELPPEAEADMNEEQKLELRRVLQMYYAQVTAVDHEIGRLREGLKKLGADRNTIILYTSDHGDVLGNNNRMIVDKYTQAGRSLDNTIRTKGKPFSSAYRIPLIIFSPDTKNPGRKSAALVSSVDLVPTILDLAGIEVPDYMQGTSMADWVTLGKGPEQPYLYLGLNEGGNAWRAVWDGRYVLSALDYQLFYDLENDPFETNNLYADPGAETRKKHYADVLLQLAEKTGDPILPRLKAELEE